MNWLGLDIGGANLKAADGQGFAISRFFPLWQRRDELPHALTRLLADVPPADALAITMTGELADCFRTKSEGVGVILDAVSVASAGRLVRVYQTDGTWVDPPTARGQPLLAAASNWHALARFAARWLPRSPGLLIDIGSTTTDLIPLVDGLPAAQGQTDPERLAARELVYTGVQRSPVCAVTDRLPWRGRLCPVAQELFATMWDAYLLTGDLAEEPQSTHTADGRPATRRLAHERMARMICADREMVDLAEATAMAHAAAERQLCEIVAALAAVVGRLPGPLAGIVVSGQGESLARRAVQRLGLDVAQVSLGQLLGPELSQVATAYALAVLAREALVNLGR